MLESPEPMLKVSTPKARMQSLFYQNEKEEFAYESIEEIKDVS